MSDFNERVFGPGGFVKTAERSTDEFSQKRAAERERRANLPPEELEKLQAKEKQAEIDRTKRLEELVSRLPQGKNNAASIRELYESRIEDARRRGDDATVRRLEQEVDDAIRIGERDRQKTAATLEATRIKQEKELDAILNPIYTTADQQALLLYNLDKFANIYNEGPEHYGEVLGDSVLARTHIFAPKKMDKLMGIKNELLSSLIPRVKLFKVADDDTETEITFETYQDPINAMTNSRVMNTGAGLKSVSIDKDGSNKATAETQVLIKMSLYFSSLEEVFKQRGKFSYADLITPSSKRVSNDNSPYYERIRADIGYSTPTGNLWKNEGALRDVIMDSQRSYYLVYHSHNIDLRENGSVTLEVEYHGYIEKRTLQTDIFELTMTEEEVRRLRKAQSEAMSLSMPKPSRNPCSPSRSLSEEEKKRIDARVKALREENAAKRSKAYSAFLEKILKEGMNYSMEFSKKEIRGLRLLKNEIGAEVLEDSPVEALEKVTKEPVITTGGGLGAGFGALVEGVKGLFSDKDTKKKKKGAVKNSKGNYQVDFFFLGDLLNTIFGLAKKEESFRDFDFVFGTIPYRDHTTGNVDYYSITQIPISMSSFSSWFMENVIKKGERTNYNVRDLITDILNNLITNVFLSKDLQSEEAGAYGRGVLVPRFEYGVFNTKETQAGKTYPYAKLLKVYNGRNGRGKFRPNIFVYATNSRLERSIVTKNEAEDAKRGIYHIVAAREHGMVKRVKFSREQQKYLREHLMVSGGSGKPGEVFRDIYNADVEMFGNPIFSPGMQVYIKTLAYDREYAELLQIIGYYRVIKVSSVIEGGKFKTDLQCRWEFLGTDKERDGCQ